MNALRRLVRGLRRLVTRLPEPTPRLSAPEIAELKEFLSAAQQDWLMQVKESARHARSVDARKAGCRR